ncbi:hypothetical protein C8J57DRAFT_1310911 [Mycena rebaudengoi]|nr:hypothetical protein C8J57DRAFT_1310911 [Mycena rebaudengoi]
MSTPYQLRKVFVIPLAVSTVVWSFTMCYGWWHADSIQFLLLGSNFLLFILSAYLLQKRRVQPPATHSFTLFFHLYIAVCLVFMNRYRAIGLGDIFYDMESKIPPMSAGEQILDFFALMLRIVAIYWSTTISFLSCIVLSDRTDILTERENNMTYMNLSAFMSETGFTWFVGVVKPAPFSSLIPFDSKSIVAENGLEG